LETAVIIIPATGEKVKRFGVLILGWFFVGLGIIGLFLPLLQGILFIMIGLAFLSSRSATIKRLLNGLERRYPDHYQRMETLKNKVSGWFKKSR
jgi:uncharacterized membrane protein YbaN (DUF454 family)